MAQKCFYDVLLVDQTATLDEIKLAFKRRALQVHPDKGGSKEEFQLVYQAFETLVDPKARRKYDHQARQSTAQKQRSQRHKTSKKRGNGSSAVPKPKGKPKAAASKRPFQSETGRSTPQTSQSKETKLLMKIRALLQKLPREVRNDVITKQFSQKQRLILERWMVDVSSETPAGSEVQPSAVVLQRDFASISPQAMEIQTLQNPSNLKNQTSSQCKNSHGGLASLATCVEDPTKEIARPRARHFGRNKILNKESCKRSRRFAGSGSLHKIHSGKVSSYRARICFDSVELCTHYGDLQTALEYLVILTAAKQKIEDKNSAAFEERLQAALISAAQEHGRNIADLHIRYAISQRASFFIGKHFMLNSPCVRSTDALRKLRGFLNPFRAYATRHTRGSRIYSWYSPTHLEDAWERFQNAVANAWKAAGADSAKFIQKIRASYNARAAARLRQLQNWERQQMGREDKNRYRPRSARERSTKNFEYWERQNMALEDQSKHRPKVLRERDDAKRMATWERQQMAMQDKNCHRPRRLRWSLHRRAPSDILTRNLFLLKRLLTTWKRRLERDAQQVDKERRKLLRQKKLEVKRRRAEQRRLEASNRKRLREERLQKEKQRKRMKSADFTMSDIPWI